MENPSDVLVSEDERGIFFWSAPLTDKQAEKLKATMEGIEDIVNDEALIMSESPMTAKKIQKRSKRAVIQDDAPPHLEFISTPPPDSESDSNPVYSYSASKPPDASNVPAFSSFRYAYLEDAGRFILGYWIDLYSFARATDVEFTTNSIIQGTLKALQPAGYEWGGSDYGLPGHMLGAISLIAGLKFGVAKKARVTLVEVVPHASSFLDALIKIKKSLNSKNEQFQRVKGYTVVGTGYGGRATVDESIKIAVKMLIQELIDDYQIVFVTAAGNDEILYSQMKTWPAIWASDDFPIITVAGIDIENGKRSSRSSFGPAVTVSAPSWVVHSRGSLGLFYSSGTCNSAALTMGLAMSYLSDPSVRDVLNLAENALPNPSVSVTRKIRDYIVQMAYPRPPGGVRAIWNGLSSADPEYHRVGVGLNPQ